MTKPFLSQPLRKPLSVMGLAVCLAGCAVTAEHQPLPAPDVQTLQQLSGQVTGQSDQTVHADRWWQAFADPQLEQRVAQALENNHDLAATALRLEAALARLQVSRDQRRPQGGVSGELDLARQQGSSGLDVSRQERVALGLAADWQLDLFGRISARIRQAQAGLDNQQALRAQSLADVVSGVVETYIRLMGTEEQLSLLDKQLQLLNQSVDVLQLRVDEGLSTPLELSRAQTLLYEYRARKPDLAVERTRYQEALAALTGQTLSDLKAGMQIPQLYSEQTLALQISEPERALRQAPEVLLAEARVAMAVALSDEAKASLYPDISVSGVLGWLSASSLNLSDAREQIAVQPRLTWSLFNLSALRSELAARSLEERAVLAEYENTWLNLLNRADGAILDWQAYQDRLTELDQRQAYARSAYEQARSRYEEGIIPYLDYLDAQRDLLNSEADLVSARTRKLEAYTRLQRVFSGTWVPGLTADS